MALPADSIELQISLLVTRYATPFAVLLIALGLYSYPPATPGARWICWILWIGGFLMNIAVNQVMKEESRVSQILREARLKINFAINVLLVLLMWEQWQPIWMLLALTPIATAVYDTRKKTLQRAVTIAALLVGIHAAVGINTVGEWSIEVVHIAFVVCMSLMINSLSTIIRSGGAAAPSS